jgi:hypothetical protein
MLIMSRGGGVSAEKFKPTSQRLILPRTETYPASQANHPGV